MNKTVIKVGIKPNTETGKKNKRNTPRVKIHRSENMKGWEANLRYNYLNSIKTWEGIYIQNYPRYPICY